MDAPFSPNPSRDRETQSGGAVSSSYRSRPGPGAPGKKLATTVYITEEQQAQLRELSQRTRVPIAEYIREGIDLVFERHRDELSPQLELGLVAKPLAVTR